MAFVLSELTNIFLLAMNWGGGDQPSSFHTRPDHLCCTLTLDGVSSSSEYNAINLCWISQFRPAVKGHGHRIHHGGRIRAGWFRDVKSSQLQPSSAQSLPNSSFHLASLRKMPASPQSELWI